MHKLFGRAEALLYRIGKRPWVIASESVFVPPGGFYGSVFSGIDCLARAFCVVEGRHLTTDHLDQLGAESNELQEAHSYLDVSAGVVRTQLRLPPEEYSTTRSGFIRSLVNASGNAHTIGLIGTTSERADACHPDDIADLAYATLKTFLSCYSLHAAFNLFEIYDHALNKAAQGLDSLESSLASRKLGKLFQQMLDCLELDEESFGRYEATRDLRSMIMTAAYRGYSDTQTAALAGLIGVWSAKTLHEQVKTGGDTGERRRTLEEFVGPELLKLGRWLQKKDEPAQPAREHRAWLLDQLPTIHLPATGW